MAVQKYLERVADQPFLLGLIGRVTQRFGVLEQGGGFDDRLLLGFVPGQFDRLQAAGAEVDPPCRPLASRTHQLAHPVQDAARRGRQEVDRQRCPLESRQGQAAGDGKAARLLQQIGRLEGFGAADAAKAREPFDGNAQGRRLRRTRRRQRCPGSLAFGQPAAALQFGRFRPVRCAVKRRSRSATANNVASTTGALRRSQARQANSVIWPCSCSARGVRT